MSRNHLTEKRNAAGTLLARYLYDLDGNLDCAARPAWIGSECPPASDDDGVPNPDLLADYAWHFLGPPRAFRGFDDLGNVSARATYTHDALGRLLRETTTQGGTTRRTCFTHLGLSSEVTEERRVAPAEPCTATATQTKTYSFDADLERTALTASGTGPDDGTYFYGRNVHGDTSLLLTVGGDRMGSYGYSAYGDHHSSLTGEQHSEQQTYFNAYRFNDRRQDKTSGVTDMGARRYSSSLGAGRFLQVDAFESAGDDLSLALDTLTQNRYAFAAGNPVGFEETDGHAFAASGSGKPRADWRRPIQRLNPAYAQPVGDTKLWHPNQKTDRFGPSWSGLWRDTVKFAKWRVSGDNPCNRLSFSKQWECTKSVGTGFVDDWRQTGRDISSDDSERVLWGWTKVCLSLCSLGTSSIIKASIKGSMKKPALSEARVGGRGAANNLVGAACSFSGETLVLMADGSRRPISRIRVGDYVLATEPTTGKQSPKRVTHVWAHTDRVVRLVVEGEPLETTEDHPFWDATRQKWVPIQDFVAGHLALRDDGGRVRVARVSLTRSRITAAYNLTIQDVHTYHVGRLGLLVHNVCNPSRMRQEVRRGQGPPGIERVDLAHPGVPGSQPHITFSDDLPTLNLDGTWGHLGRGPIPRITNRQREWLESHEWPIPE